MRAALLLIAIAGVARADVEPRPNVVRVEHRPADDNPTLGNINAPVTAELFFVPGQVESNRAYRRVLELQERHPRRLRVILRVVARQAAVVVPVVAIEAYAQGKFDEFMDALLATRSGSVRRDDLPALAESAGLDRARVEAALERALEPELVPPVLDANERRRLRQQADNVPGLLLNGVPVHGTMTSMDVDDLEYQYDAAYEEAKVLLAEGVPIEHLVEVVEQSVIPDGVIEPYPPGPVDDPEPDYEAPVGPRPLLARPLDLTGLPAEEADRDADHNPVEVVVLCNLRYVSCRTQLEALRNNLAPTYPEEVRVVWAPWYDLAVDGNEDAPRLHAAALCAERQGAGWAWIDESLRQVFRGAGEGNFEVDALIDTVAETAQVDRAALDDCLAAVDDDEVTARVQDAIDAGVHHSPAVVIGGRAYVGGFTDWRAAQPLVDAELAPGVLGCNAFEHWFSQCFLPGSKHPDLP